MNLSPFLLSRLACLLWLLAAPLAMAVPVNDNFANAIEVSNGAGPVSGSNVGATLEAGEPIPAGYTSDTFQGTVWYVFTPQVDPDFLYEVNTLGSSIDTVVAVWVGTGLNDLALVQVNNEAFEGSVSRVRFHSHGAPDTSYYISVAGHTAAARGNISLTVQPGGPQMVTSVDAASIAPSTVDVGSASQTATFSVTMSVSSNVAAGYVKLYRPDGTLVTTATYALANRISGSNNSGVYNVVLTVPQAVAPGTYKLGFEAQASTTNALKADSFGWDQMTALDIIPTLTVQNSKYAYTQYTIDNGLSGAGAAQTADPDSDGIKNLEEFAFGMNAASPDAGSLVVTGSTLVKRGVPITFLTGTGLQQRLRVELVRRLADASQQAPAYQVEFSDDLVHWTAASNPAVVLATANGYEAVSVDDVTTGAIRTRRFAHVVISY